MIDRLQNMPFGKIFSPVMMNNMFNDQVKYGATAYSVTELLSDLKHSVWKELKIGNATDFYRRNLQKKHLNNLISLAGLSKNAAAAPPPGMSMMSFPPDATALGKVQLKQLEQEIKAAVPLMKDKMTRYHLQDCLDQIQRALVIK